MSLDSGLIVLEGHDEVLRKKYGRRIHRATVENRLGRAKTSAEAIRLFAKRRNIPGVQSRTYRRKIRVGGVELVVYIALTTEPVTNLQS